MTEATHLYVSVDDDVQVIRRPPVVVVPAVLVNGGFETPVIAAFQYAPPGATWVFASGGGISGNSSPFTNGNPLAPEGKQVGLLQNFGKASQTLAMPAGKFTLSFQAAQRGKDQLGTQIIAVQVDGVEVGRFQPPDKNYAAYTTPPFTVAAGSRVIALLGVGSGGADFTAFVDDVKIAPYVAPAYAAPTFSGPLSPGNTTPLALIVGVAVALGQYVSSPQPLSWTPLDTPMVSLTAAGLLTAKAAGSATLNVEVDDGH